MSGLTRRQFATALGTALGLSAVGCASTAQGPRAPERPYSRLPWRAPRISGQGVFRVVVGHRPYRRNGFRVESVRYDDKVVVHNYGHGGGGLSLGWGSSALAVREVVAIPPAETGVLGSGIMGLCTARLLQDRGWTVTIYTRDAYQHTTSNIAAGEWRPTSTHARGTVDDQFLARLDWAARVSHHAYANLVGTKYGIRWLENYELRRSPPSRPDPSTFRDLYPYSADLSPGDHPFGNWHARRRVTIQIDPGTLLRQLVADFQAAGGIIVTREFRDLSDVLSLREKVLFNCTGLGAATLFEDEQLVPAKGQLVMLPPDPGVDFMTHGGGYGGHRGFLHMFPRGDAVVLGGFFKAGDSSRHVEPEATERIVEEHRTLFSSFGLGKSKNVGPKSPCRGFGYHLELSLTERSAISCSSSNG